MSGSFCTSGDAGAERAIGYAVRDLPLLERVLQLVVGRRAVVQAGGSFGVFAKHLARTFEAVYCFEPAPQVFRQLAANVPDRHVILLQAALGDCAQLVETVCARRDGSGRPPHPGLTYTQPGGIVPQVRLDDLALPVLDLLYLDIEGAELFALRGAEATLARCRPVVAIEVNRSCEYAGLAPDDARRFLRSHGYEHALSVGSDEVFLPC